MKQTLDPNGRADVKVRFKGLEKSAFESGAQTNCTRAPEQSVQVALA